MLGSIAPQAALTFALLFGLSAVVEYLTNFNGVGRVLRSLSFAYEIRDLVVVTTVTTLLLWVAQELLRRMILGFQGML